MSGPVDDPRPTPDDDVERGVPYRHLVLFRIHDDVDEPTLAHAERTLAALADLPGLLAWNVRRSDDERKGRILIENALFADRAAFAAFREHPRHAEVATIMRDIADWWIGDHPEPAPPQV